MYDVVVTVIRDSKGLFFGFQKSLSDEIEIINVIAIKNVKRFIKKDCKLSSACARFIYYYTFVTGCSIFVTQVTALPTSRRILI